MYGTSQGFGSTVTTILLLSPPSDHKAEFPRLALAYLSGSLKHHIIHHDLLELSLYNNWKSKLRPYLFKHHYISITATTGEMDDVEILTEYIKDINPDCVIILGGIHATICPDESLRTLGIDYCIRGEGEDALVEFLKGNKPINLCWGGHIGKIELLSDLNNRPFPNYDKFELGKYLDSTFLSRSVQVLTSRGCPYNCTFCSKGLGDTFRPRAPVDVVSEIEYLKTTYNVKKIRIVDDNFSFDLDRAKEICRLMISRNLNIKWISAGGLRVDKVDDELLDLMVKSGCASTGLGIESVSNDILKEYKKAITIEKVVNAIKLCKKHGLKVGGYFVIGAPSDTKESIYAQLEFAKKMELDYAYWSLLIPYPGCALYDWVTKNNYWTVQNPIKVMQSASTKSCQLYSTPLLSAEEKVEIIKEVETEWVGWDASRNLFNRVRLFIMKRPLLMKWMSKMKTIYDTLR